MPEISKRRNRNCYDGGFALGEEFAFCIGHVVSNLDTGRGGLLAHETLHVWQSYIFGPIYQLTYVSWALLGLIFTCLLFGWIGLAKGQKFGQSIMDIAYLDNPWEIWAYTLGGYRGGGIFCISVTGPR